MKYLLIGLLLISTLACSDVNNEQNQEAENPFWLGLHDKQIDAIGIEHNRVLDKLLNSINYESVDLENELRNQYREVGTPLFNKTLDETIKLAEYVTPKEHLLFLSNHKDVFHNYNNFLKYYKKLLKITLSEQSSVLTATKEIEEMTELAKIDLSLNDYRIFAISASVAKKSISYWYSVNKGGMGKYNWLESKLSHRLQLKGCGRDAAYSDTSAAITGVVITASACAVYAPACAAVAATGAGAAVWAVSWAASSALASGWSALKCLW